MCVRELPQALQQSLGQAERDIVERVAGAMHTRGDTHARAARAHAPVRLRACALARTHTHAHTRTLTRARTPYTCSLTTL